MKKILFLFAVVVIVFWGIGCDTNNDDVPVKESLLTINNATDIELHNHSNRFDRQSTGSGIIGTWTQYYESTTNGNVTGRRNTEWTFSEPKGFNGYTSNWRYGSSSGWQPIGQPYTESGNFSIGTINGKKVITIMIYNYNDGSYMAKYRDTAIYVSENYLVIGNLVIDSNTDAAYSFEVNNIKTVLIDDGCEVLWDNPIDNNFSHVVISYYSEGNESKAVSQTLQKSVSSYYFENKNTVDYVKFVTVDKNNKFSNGVIYKIFNPKDYGLTPYVPEYIIGIWCDEPYIFLHPDSPTLTNQLSVIEFTKTTASTWIQRLDGSIITGPSTQYIQADEENKTLYGFNEYNPKLGIFGTWGNFGIRRGTTSQSINYSKVSGPSLFPIYLGKTSEIPDGNVVKIEVSANMILKYLATPGHYINYIGTNEPYPSQWQNNNYLQWNGNQWVQFVPTDINSQ